MDGRLGNAAGNQEPHLMTVLQEVLLLTVVPKATQKLLHCVLILPVSAIAAPCETLKLLPLTHLEAR
jgi:hypothetical protein